MELKLENWGVIKRIKVVSSFEDELDEHDLEYYFVNLFYKCFKI